MAVFMLSKSIIGVKIVIVNIVKLELMQPKGKTKEEVIGAWHSGHMD